MKKYFLYALASLLLGAGASCRKDADATPEACASGGKVVKMMTAASGTVYFNTVVQHYVISIPEPGTIDVVDYGVVCGTLPGALRADGTKVLVSGSLREYDQQPAGPAGATYYYLAIAQVGPR